VPRPDEGVRAAAVEALAGLAKPVGALGRIEDLAAWLAACQGECPPRPLERTRVVVFAGDHGIAEAGVSAYPAEVTALMVRTFVAGGAAVNLLARAAGAGVRVLDLGVAADLAAVPGMPRDVTRYKVRAGSARIDRSDALTRDEAEQAFLAGMAVADEEVDSGADLLVPGDMGIGNTTPATALIVVLTGAEVSSLVGRGTGVDDHGWMRKTAAVRDAARRGRSRRSDPIDLVAAIGGADIAATAGFLVQAAVRRTPVVLDGIVSGAAALVAQRVTHRTTAWYVAGHRSVEPAHHAALARLELAPLLDLGLRLGEGTGALLAVPLVDAASRLLVEMASLSDVLGSADELRP
jgi:nicotinate-nucleotide--dimethylbenzimidazole phosphoribosyltransferase